MESTDKLDRIRAAAEDVLGSKVDAVEPMPHVTNNTVFRLSAAGRDYIFKIYAERDWPEDGKLAFVNRRLTELGVPCAKLIAFNRSDARFPTGYLIEEMLGGGTAEHGDASLTADPEAGAAFYRKLARFMSAHVHRIVLDGFGYIGSGTPSHRTHSDYVSDKYDELTTALVQKRRFERAELAALKPLMMERLRACADLPPVLNHGDLSTKNVIIGGNGELALIDWDDAIADNWIADVARLTYWMKYAYGPNDYASFRGVFLAAYGDAERIRMFESHEHVYHVWFGLDHLCYYPDGPAYERTLRYYRETLALLNQ